MRPTRNPQNHQNATGATRNCPEITCGRNALKSKVFLPAENRGVDFTNRSFNPMNAIQRVSITPAPMSPELVKSLYDSMTDEGKDQFVDGFHPEDHDKVRRAINRPVGWFIPQWDRKHVKFVRYNPDTADRASRRDNYIPVYSEIECYDDEMLSIAAMNSILEEIQ